MQEFSLKSQLRFPAARAWEVLLDDEGQSRLYLEGLQFESCKVGELIEQGDTVKRRLDVVPRLDLPKAVRKVLGEKFGYSEHMVFNKSTQLWTWHLDMPSLGERMKVGGEIRIEDNADGSTSTRKADFRIECKIFGVGSLMEKEIKKQTLANYEKSAVWLNTQG